MLQGRLTLRFSKQSLITWKSLWTIAITQNTVLTSSINPQINITIRLDFTTILWKRLNHKRHFTIQRNRNIVSICLEDSQSRKRTLFKETSKTQWASHLTIEMLLWVLMVHNLISIKTRFAKKKFQWKIYLPTNL